MPPPIGIRGTSQPCLHAGLANIGNIQAQITASASRSIRPRIDESTYVITSYLVANAIVLSISGWLSTVISRKCFYMICVASFAFASLLCGFAWSLQALVLFRILQGLAGGGMATSEQAILADSFPPAKRG